MVFKPINSSAQFYDTATMISINSSRSAIEGDMYLDTVLNEYRIGLTHGKLGTLNDNQNLDILFFRNDSLLIEIEDESSVKMDFSPINNYPGDIKPSFRTADHSGWYLMDSRAISTLSANARALCFATNLPNADNRVMKAPTRGLSTRKFRW